MGDQINYNNIGYNKFNKISDMVSPKKKQSACKIINLVKVYRKESWENQFQQLFSFMSDCVTLN